MLQEKTIKGFAGWLMIVALVLLTILFGYLFVDSARNSQPELAVAALVAMAVTLVCMGGFTVVNPNEARSDRAVRNLQGHGQGAGLLVGQSADAQAEGFAAHSQLRERQAEGQRPGRQPDRDRRGGGLAGGRDGGGDVRGGRLRALRPRAERVGRCARWRRAYPYDAHVEGQMSLRMRVADDRAPACATRSRSGCEKAGVEVIEARISHLAYAPEIASAMLRRQQASAIIAARQKIVEGAVGHGRNGAGHAQREERRRRSTKSARPAWSATCWWSCAAIATRSRSSTRERCISRTRVGTGYGAKAFLLRLDPATHEALQRWADADLRSLNAQIEFLLRRALVEAGRLRTAEEKPVEEQES